MAPRYLAIHADSPERLKHHSEQISHQLGFVEALSAPCLRIFVSSDAPIGAFTGRSGLVVGHIFKNLPAPEAVVHWPQQECHAILKSAGAHLVSQYWGGYVAFLIDSLSQRATVIRDPSGQMPCIVLEKGNMTIIASDIETILDAGFCAPSVDWDYMTRLLFAADLRTPRSGLVGVTDLLAGHAITLGDARRCTTQLWSPWDHVRPDLVRADADQAALIETTVRMCLSAWSRCYSHILLGLSGGLDSSIIAASIANEGVVTALTLTTDECGGDERRYARQVADWVKLPLIEREHRLVDVDMTRVSGGHLPRPIQYALGQSEIATKRKLAGELGLDAYFTGIGGDNVFCYLQSASPLIDRWRTPGQRSHAWRTLNDLCCLTDVSWFDCLAMAFRRVTRPAAYRWEGDATFLTCPPTNEALGHPWLDNPRNILPGKAAHVSMLVRIQGTIDGFERRHMPAQINPLLSQPIMEACLRIPTWDWVSGGRNRSVVRQAFTDSLPSQIVRRRTKGGPDSFASELLAGARGRLNDRLREGMLVSRGIVDGGTLNARLDDPKPFSPKEGMRLMALTEAENWVRHWSALSARSDERGKQTLG